MSEQVSTKSVLAIVILFILLASQVALYEASEWLSIRFSGAPIPRKVSPREVERCQDEERYCYKRLQASIESA